MDGQKIWNLIANSFKTQISASSYKTWFSNCFVVDFKTIDDKKLLIIAVKNSFLKEQIELRFISQIKDVLVKEGVGDVEIVFIVSQKEDTKPVSEPLFTGVAQTFFGNVSKAESLNPAHNFNNFVVGFSNNLAYAAATQVAGSLASYNPLLFYGPTGVGKTHLLQAIGNEVVSKSVDAKVMYVSAEKFTNDFLESLRNKSQEAFRYKYRKVDVLLVDDIQFFAGKESTQDEFFFTFNDLFLAGKQLVLACDRHPRELGRLKDRLVSRFLGGLACDVGMPDLEMKMAIVRAKCEQKGVEIDPGIIEEIAKTCRGGARELEGVLVSVLASIKLSGTSVNISEITNALSVSEKSFSNIAPSRVVEIVCKHFRVKSEALRGTSRKANLVYARQVLAFLLRNDLGYSLASIGEIIGGRDHSTVIHAIEKVEGVVSTNQFKSDEVLRLRKLLVSN